MQHVLTLTTDPSRPVLTGAHAERARATLADAGASTASPDWLAEGHALDIVFGGVDPVDVTGPLGSALSDVPADINVQPREGRRKLLLVADMDSTIITGESLDELADFIGIRDRIAPITERAMRGEIDFETALRDRVHLLAGQSATLLDRLVEERIALTDGALALIATMRANGAYTALVSGGFTAVTAAVAVIAGFDTHRGNVLLVEDGLLTGAVGEPILGQDAKLESLLSFCSELSLSAAQAMAVGDGANDIPMLQHAGTGVAFHAKPAVAAATGFRVDHGDLTALLYLQGYRADQIIR